MGFRFPLATLLRLREIAKQREERLLGQILGQMAQSQQTLADLAAQRLILRVQRGAALQQSTSAFEIMEFDRRLGQIDDLELAGKDHLLKLTALREQQMKIFEAAHRNHELLSGMRSDLFDSFQRESARQEQNAMDDNFSSRRKLS